MSYPDLSLAVPRGIPPNTILERVLCVMLELFALYFAHQTISKCSYFFSCGARYRERVAVQLVTLAQFTDAQVIELCEAVGKDHLLFGIVM